jgi:hypothetical protein
MMNVMLQCSKHSEPTVSVTTSAGVILTIGLMADQVICADVTIGVAYAANAAAIGRAGGAKERGAFSL